MNNPKFTKYKDSASDFRFRLRAENGEIILHSEGYKSSSACNTGIASVKINSQFDSNFTRQVASNGQYYFVLKASNGEPIGASEMYQSIAGRDNGIASVKRVAPNAPTEDLT